MMLSLPIHLGRVIRLALTRDKTRWRKEAGRTPVWDERNQIIADLIRPGASVLDFGAGAQTLRRHLPADCEYQPCDLFQSTPETLVCNFNRKRYPAVAKRYDYVVCSGVMEYIRDPKRFLSRLSDFADIAILTYAVSDKTSRMQRIGYGWVNHLTRSALETLLGEVGYSFDLVASWETHLIYRLRAVRANSMAEPKILS